MPREGGGDRRRARRSQSAGPAGRERPVRGVGALAAVDVAQRGQQDLLDGALDRPQAERRLERAVGAIAVERAERAHERVDVGVERPRARR